MRRFVLALLALGACRQPTPVASPLPPLAPAAAEDASRDVRWESADGQWRATLWRDPEIDGPIPRVAIAAFFHRGAPSRVVTAGELPAGALNIVSDRLEWLGQGAPLERSGALEVPLRGGGWARFEFVPPEAKPAAVQTTPPSPQQLFYLDDEGTLHVVDGPGNIPPRYRKSAVEVNARGITVMAMPPPPPSEPWDLDPPPPRRQARTTPAPVRRAREPKGPAPYGLTYMEWLRVLTGQRGLGDPDRPTCIGNDGQPKHCNE